MTNRTPKTKSPKTERTGFKLKALAAIMHDPELTAATRCVGFEICERFNQTVGETFVAQQTMADVLNLEIRTVRTAVHALRGRGHIRIRKAGDSYYYSLCLFDALLAGANESGPEKNASETGQKRSAPPEKNRSLYPSESHSVFPSLRQPVSNARERGETVSGRGRLQDRKGDELVELKVVKLFDREGYDGYQIVSTLHEQDPQLRLRLLSICRHQEGTIESHEIHAAAMAASYSAATPIGTRLVRDRSCAATAAKSEAEWQELLAPSTGTLR